MYENSIELKKISSNYNLLYVEDDKELAQKYISYFLKLFKNVTYSQNGLEALEEYKNNEFELVLTDIQMPKMNGLDLSREIKKLNNKQNIIVTSAYSDMEYFMDSIHLGIDSYITKPVSFVDLNNVLLKVVSRIKIEKENIENIEKLVKTYKEIDKKNSELTQYSNILNQVAIVSKTDIKGYITYINDLFCEVSEYSREELLGVNHNIIRHPDMSKEIFKDLWKTIKSGKSWEGSIKNKSKSGVPYFVYATIIPVYDSDMKIKEYIGIRFLTTKEVNEKRNFQKNVIAKYQEFQKINSETSKINKKLEEKVLLIQKTNENLNKEVSELKDKNIKTLTQLSFSENEIKKINFNYSKLIEKTRLSLSTSNKDYKDIKSSFEMQKKELFSLKEDHDLKKDEIVELRERLHKQSNIIKDLNNTIKNID